MGCSVILCGALACVTLQPASGPAASPAETAEVAEIPAADRVVEIVAERFLFTPSEITVEAGTILEIRLTSEDTDHGFRIVGPHDIDVAIPKRGQGEATIRFEAADPGDYRFECSRICGAGHNYMRGVIRVRANPSERQDGGGSR